MTKSELMARLAELFIENNEGTELQAKDIEYGVKVLVDTMTRSLAKGQRIEIRGFGSFDLNYRPPRVGRNPKTGAAMTIAEHVIVRFKASEALKTAVNHKPLLK